MVLASGLTPVKPRPRLPKISLEPASPAVPAATEKNKHYQDDDEKCRGVHVASCACGCEREPAAESTRPRIDQFLFSRNGIFWCRVARNQPRSTDRRSRMSALGQKQTSVRGVRMPCLAPWRCREVSPSQHRLLGRHQSQEKTPPRQLLRPSD